MREFNKKQNKRKRDIDNKAQYEINQTLELNKA